VYDSDIVSEETLLEWSTLPQKDSPNATVLLNDKETQQRSSQLMEIPTFSSMEEHLSYWLSDGYSLRRKPLPHTVPVESNGF
jgi:hypothetical protein